MIAKTKTIGKVNYLLSHRPLAECPAPSIVYLAVEHTRAPKADVFVKEGDHVNFCQKVGMRHGPFFEQPIFSTVSGTVLGIEALPEADPLVAQGAQRRHASGHLVR
ncbi:MAG: hypothetical protein ACI4UT_03520, partial [Candidatus Enteromonas sp.]